MPESTSSHVELTCLQGLADLERLEGPWAETLNALKITALRAPSRRHLTDFDIH